MILTYIKLNEWDKAFPLHFNGLFNDGMNSFPIFQNLMGEILFESDKPIGEADKEFLQLTNNKKIPGDVVIQFNKYES